MSNYQEEGIIKKYPIWVSLEKTEEIIKQMKTKVWKINLKNKKNATGFFLKINIQIKEVKVLITNNHVIDETILNIKKQIMLYVNKNKIYIKLDNKMKYTNKKYDLTIIEINEDDEIKLRLF